MKPYTHVLLWFNRESNWKLSIFGYHGEEDAAQRILTCGENALMDNCVVAIVDVRPVEPVETLWMSRGWTPLDIEDRISEGERLVRHEAKENMPDLYKQPQKPTPNP